MPQVLDRPLASLATTAAKVFTFTVTLRHERTEDEQSFEIETPTDSPLVSCCGKFKLNGLHGNSSGTSFLKPSTTTHPSRFQAECSGTPPLNTKKDKDFICLLQVLIIVLYIGSVQKTQHMSELILGFGKSPIRRSVYINRQYPNCVWYFWDGQNNAHIPIVETDLFCFIDSISVRENEFKGKAVEKIEVNVSADHPYRLVAGIETAFARSFVSALLAPFDFTQPVAIWNRAISLPSLKSCYSLNWSCGGDRAVVTGTDSPKYWLKTNQLPFPGRNGLHQRDSGSNSAGFQFMQLQFSSILPEPRLLGGKQGYC
jgi:hypothetical protein